MTAIPSPTAALAGSTPGLAASRGRATSTRTIWFDWSLAPGAITCRARLTAILVGLAVALGLGLSPRADAYVYWIHGSSGPNGAIGRALNNGTSPDQNFVASSVELVTGLVIDGAHIYWTNVGSIGRANVDGTAPDVFISGVNSPWAVAVDSAHIYWTNPFNGTVARANLDGTSPNQNFMAHTKTYGVAVDSTHIYWTNYDSNTIGRANLDGSHPNNIFITGANKPEGVAVQGGHIYWTNYGGTTIGRANVDGSSINPNFITGLGFGTCGVAADASQVVWTNYNSNRIGRANLDGSAADPNFMTGVSQPCAIAVDTLGQSFTFKCCVVMSPSGWTLSAAGPIGKGAIVHPVLRKPRLIGLVVSKLPNLTRALRSPSQLPRPTLVGLVPLGRHRASKQRIPWNLKVNGNRLKDGTYEVDLKIFTAKGKPANLPGPRPERLVIKNGRVHVGP